ncbi:MAG TPA: hypothetical protein VNK96_06185 [Fimbriimonadales bacterium]|nr:hypothetical protein [Fimbriimonadales bacterium]
MQRFFASLSENWVHRWLGCGLKGIDFENPLSAPSPDPGDKPLANRSTAFVKENMLFGHLI